jgi:phage tail sheath gpL-like
MANKVTGITDTTGALTTIPMAIKSALIVAKASEDKTADIGEKEMFSITGTADASAVFGDGSVAQKIVRVLISNGVDNIKGIVVPATGETALADTLDASLMDETIKCIITDTNDTQTVSAIKDHLTKAESNDLARYAFFAPSEEDTKDQVKLAAFAKTIDHNRIFIPGPSLYMADGVTVADPQVAAAGLAGLVMTETDDPALPMNGVAMAGFGGATRMVLVSERDALANAGITALYNEGNTPTVWRLVTSKVGDPIWQEGSTRFIADYVLERVMTMLRANYKRTKNVTRILEAIKSDVKVVLQDIEALEIIENFDEATLTVSRDPSDMYGAIVNYEFDVVTPLYTITINQHMKL